MFINENKPEKSGRLVPRFKAQIAANPNKAPPPMGKVSVRNGLTRSGSSVRMSKALKVDIFKYFAWRKSKDAITERGKRLAVPERSGVVVKSSFSRAYFFAKMPIRKTKKFRRDRTEISCCLKYSIFSVNVVCWVRIYKFQNKNLFTKLFMQNFRLLVSAYSAWVFGLLTRKMCLAMFRPIYYMIQLSSSSFRVLWLF